MGDHTPACIRISGRILLPGDLSILARAALLDGTAPDWGGEQFRTPDDVAAHVAEAIRQAAPCTFHDLLCRDGRLTEMIAACMAIGLAFTHHRDAGNGYDGDIMSWMPGWDEPVTALAVGTRAAACRSDLAGNHHALLHRLAQAEGDLPDFPRTLSAAPAVLAGLPTLGDGRSP
jgi:hypothetical protein